MPKKKKAEVTKTTKKTTKKAEETKPKMTTEEAKARVQQEVNARIQKCGDEIKAVLQRYGCDIDVAIVLRPPNQIMPNIRIVAIQ